MRYAQRHNSNLSNNSNGSVTPLSRSRRVASIPSNIANANDRPLDGENDYKNDYKNDYNNKSSNKTNGKSENLFNFIIAKDLEDFKNGQPLSDLVCL